MLRKSAWKGGTESDGELARYVPRYTTTHQGHRGTGDTMTCFPITVLAACILLSLIVREGAAFELQWDVLK